MRFFSPEWLMLEDAARANQVVENYNAFLRSLSGPVADKIRGFDGAHSLHDALLDRLTIDAARKAIEFDLVAGDNDRGYVLLSLRYAEARLIAPTVKDVSDALDSRSTEVRYDEFDLIGQGGSAPRYVHRFLLWPADRKEFAIEFDDFDFAAKPRVHRGYETYGETFREEDDSLRSAGERD